MTRMAVRSPSYAQAAAEYEDAIGGGVSASSVWRVASRAGDQMARLRQGEATRARAPAQRGEDAGERRLPLVEPVRGQANLSTDGGMIHLREEGWKEVKISTISQVETEPSAEKPGEQEVHLTRHSYVATLESADDFARSQYAEGVRRGLEEVPRLSSVNDGAAWIQRITRTNFPAAVQIVDWQHAHSRLSQVARAVWSQRQLRQQWLDDQLDHLKAGEVGAVIQALRQVEPELNPDDPLSSSSGYFQYNRLRMRYDHFRTEGFPIGSGTVESAVNNVVQHRMHRPGRGWQRESASGMLALLAEYHSNRFDQTWEQAVAA